MHIAYRYVMVAATALTVCTPAARAADASRGADLFASHCAECHSVREGKNRKGPSLHAVVGRKAGQLDGFIYSDAMKTSQLVWTRDKLSAYLQNPGHVVPGGKMKYEGMADAADRAALIDWLAARSE